MNIYESIVRIMNFWEGFFLHDDRVEVLREFIFGKYSLYSLLIRLYFKRKKKEKSEELNLPISSDLNDLFSSSIQNFKKVVMHLKGLKHSLARYYMGSFESIDYEIYYCVIRYFKPSLIIEVGAGYSTTLAAYTIKQNRKGRIIAIDPSPRVRLPKKVIWIKSLIEDINPQIFKSLAANDILFIDSSHTRKEAEYHVNSILPYLKKNVIVHYHDILYPYQSKTGEDNVIRNFCKENNDKIKILTGSAFLRAFAPQLLLKLVPNHHYKPDRISGSLWFIKK